MTNTTTDLKYNPALGVYYDDSGHLYVHADWMERNSIPRGFEIDREMTSKGGYKVWRLKKSGSHTD